MVDEAKSKYKPNVEKSLEPEIDGKMGGDREVKEDGFKNDQGQNKESGNMAGEERKLEDTVVVMDNELITSEIVEGGQSTKEEATVVVELVHGDEVRRTELHDGTEVEACCPICYEDVPQPETFTVFRCFHRFCYACMRLYLTSTLELRKPLLCPTYGCKTEIETVDCNVFASPAQIAMMIQRKADESIEVSDRVYCPNPQCSFLMSARGLAVLDAALPGARKCLQCGLRFCINCNMEWHRKMTCGQFQKTMAYKKSGTAVFDAAARKLGWQRVQKVSLYS
uniref:RBR-type E3 ubiquitin transferase n=1 Tax=Noccaea caerulescens TaxID=107243 RepID=A0A1J3I2S4_NOCCA